jgi:hypothetical protein
MLVIGGQHVAVGAQKMTMQKLPLQTEVAALGYLVWLERVGVEPKKWIFGQKKLGEEKRGLRGSNE